MAAAETSLLLPSSDPAVTVAVVVTLDWRDQGPWLSIVDEGGLWAEGQLERLPRLLELLEGHGVLLGRYPATEPLISHEGWLLVRRWLESQGVYPSAWAAPGPRLRLSPLTRVNSLSFPHASD